MRIVGISGRLTRITDDYEWVGWILRLWNTGNQDVQVKYSLFFLDSRGFTIEKTYPKTVVLKAKQTPTFTDNYQLSRAPDGCSKIRVDIETPAGVISSQDVVDRMGLLSSTGGGSAIRRGWGPVVTASDPYQIVVEGSVVNDSARPALTSAILSVREDSGRTIGETTLNFDLAPGQTQDYRQVFANSSRSGRVLVQLTFY